jgi:hypothetical protein
MYLGPFPGMGVPNRHGARNMLSTLLSKSFPRFPVKSGVRCTVVNSPKERIASRLLDLLDDLQRLCVCYVSV